MSKITAKKGYDKKFKNGFYVAYDFTNENFYHLEDKYYLDIHLNSETELRMLVEILKRKK